MNRRQAKKDFRNRTQADFDKAVFRSGYDAAVREVLEIINNIEQKSDDVTSYDVGFTKACNEIRTAIRDLKGGEE